MDRGSVSARWQHWSEDHQLWIELFVLFNFAALVVDIFFAHSTNQFRERSEYIPLLFSAGAAVALAVAAAVRTTRPRVWRIVGHIVGWLAIAVGLVGVVLHLDSQFFYARTIRSLTYAAPFAAPLAYAGLGLLLLANRLVEAGTLEWALWMLLLALGGVVGNFVFSLTDHAQNGFFNPVEWIPVASSALSIGFMLVPFVVRVNAAYVRLCALVLFLQAIVGVIGFGFHAAADFRQPGATLLDRILSGAPPMAPLLFPNLVILAFIALWVLAATLEKR
jgi:hypothetical protein